MAISRKIAFVFAIAALLWGGIASAHRMPEVYVTLEASDLDGEPVTAVTVRLHAEDAIALLANHDQAVFNLDTRSEHEALAGFVTQGLTTEGGPLSFLGGEVDGHAVLLYMTAPPGLSVVESAILSSIYNQWTNRVTDLTADTPGDKVFTQGGDLTHRH
ncbi:MAG: hypothetical protein AAFR65_11735 [Pseudomonadota bacterium]